MGQGEYLEGKGERRETSRPLLPSSDQGPLSARNRSHYHGTGAVPTRQKVTESVRAISAVLDSSVKFCELEV